MRAPFKDPCIWSLVPFNSIYMALKRKVDVSIEELASAATWPRCYVAARSTLSIIASFFSPHVPHFRVFYWGDT